MSTITKTERRLALAEANRARAMYRAAQALPWALALLSLVGAGMWVLK